LLPGINLIGALLVFRFVYFLVPLALGSIVFAITEIVFRRRDAAGRNEVLGAASP
jgi:glycosyltransferase 2 family protein